MLHAVPGSCRDHRFTNPGFLALILRFYDSLGLFSLSSLGCRLSRLYESPWFDIRRDPCINVNQLVILLDTI